MNEQQKQPNFFERLSSLIKRTPEEQIKTGGVIPNLDFLREQEPREIKPTSVSTPVTISPEEEQKLMKEMITAPIVVGKKMGEFGVELGREMFTRPIASGTLEVGKAIAPPEKKPLFEKFQPQTPIEKAIFGEEPIEPYSTTIAKWKKWIEEKTGIKLPQYLSVPAVFLLGTLDLPPFGLTKNVVKGVIKKFGKEIGEEIIKRGPEFAERALKAEGEEIPKIIEELKLPTREFTERLSEIIKKETPELAEKLEQRIVEKPQILFRDVHHDKELIENAKKLIKENPELAKNKVIYEPPSDENFVLGMQLIKELSAAGKNDEAIQIIEALAPKTTETGRALRSLQLYSRLTPEGFLLHAQRTLEKISENMGGVDKFLSRVLKTRAKLEPEDVKFIRETMEKAQKATSEIEKLRLTRQAIQRVEEKMPWTLKRIFYELWNLPKSFMAGLGDMSAILRQNWLYSLSHPIETSKKIWGYYVKPMLSEENLEKIIEEIYTHPNFPLMEKAKIAFTDLDANLLMREEQFRSVLAEKIPGIGPLIRATGRGYTAFLNKMRFDIANDLIENLVKPALEYGEKEKAEKLLKSIGKWVNTATGRGDIGTLGAISSELSQMLFAPKFLKASFDLINPFYYASLEPEVRKEALKNVLRALGSGLTILGIAKLLGAEVGDNPNSVDFGKIKIGHTRINVFGPFQRWAVLFSRLLSGKYVSSVTGREYELGVGFRPLTRQDLLVRFFEPKLHPSLNFLLNALEGRRFTGERFEFPGAFIDLFIPIVIQDMNDLIEEHGPIGILGVPLSILGFDVQTYGNLGNYVPYLKLLPGGGVGIETKPEKSIGYQLSDILLGERLQPTEIPIAEEQRKTALWKAFLDQEKTYLAQRKAEIKRKYLNGEIDYNTAYFELYRLYNDSLERTRRYWERELQMTEPFPFDLMSQQFTEALMQNE